MLEAVGGAVTDCGGQVRLSQQVAHRSLAWTAHGVAIRSTPVVVHGRRHAGAAGGHPPTARAAERGRGVYRRAIDALGPLTADRAVALLGRAVEKGFADAAWLRRHPPLAPLRDREDFQALVKKVEAAGKK